MKKSDYSFLKKLIPPILPELIRKVRKVNGISFSDPFSNWSSAESNAQGYDDPEILKKVFDAAMLVKNGKGTFERDSVVFQEKSYDWPVLTALTWMAAKNNGQLKVLDFGGSLGSSFFQNLEFLKDLKGLRWGIVEQPHFVKCGKENFSNDILSFHSNVKELASHFMPDTILLASVIQYIENPFEVMSEICNLKPGLIIFDRTYFSDSESDLIVNQINPDGIYQQSYPAWILSESKMLSFLAGLGYKLKFDYPCFEITALSKFNAGLKGMVFEHDK